MADTQVPQLSLPYTGIGMVDAGFSIIQQQFSRTHTDLQDILDDAAAHGGTTAPTNAPSPTGITVTVNFDGSMDVTLTWNYTQGLIGADVIVLFWKQGTAALAAPTAADKAVLLNITATSFTFQGWNPNSNYRFGISAGRNSTDVNGVVVGAIVAPTVTPDWADISATSTLNGVPTSTVVTNAANGQTAFTGTANYRSTGSPTNTPAPSGLTTGTDTDGSARYTLAWNYTQSTLKADGFLFFVKEADTSSFAITDPHFELASQNAGTFSTQITLKGYPSDRVLSFGVAAFRRTENALEIGTIITQGAAPDWQGISSGSPSYAGTIFGVEQHNFTLDVAGRDATDTTNGLTKDGAAIAWTGRDVEFQGGPRGAYGLSYNLSVYNLSTKALEYQHCYNTFDYGSGATSSDVLQPVVSGTGTLVSGQPGKFGFGVHAVCPAGQRAYLQTQAASTDFAALTWVELWFKSSAPPSAIATILGISQNADGSGYAIPILVMSTGGIVTAQAFDGATMRSISIGGNVCDGNWHHLAAAAVNGTGLFIWVDGVRGAVPVAGLTSFSVGAPGGGLWLSVLAHTAAQQFIGTADVDEVIVCNQNNFRAGAANFTPPTIEISDYAGGVTTMYAWHFQELWYFTTLYPLNARRAPRDMANVINSYCELQAASGTRYAFMLAGAHEPATNHTNGGLPAAIARIGGTQTLYSSTSFQSFAAYGLVGIANCGEGNGYEAYAGKIVSDPQAHVQLSFQTQGDKLLGTGGVGWKPTLIPGVPTNNPIPQLVTVTAAQTGTDVITIQWGYTQPAMTEPNRLADGFIVYVNTGGNATPATSSLHSAKLGNSVRGFAFEAPYQQTFSFAVAAYRNTSSGLEVGTPITSAAAPNWQTAGGGNQVTTAGVANTAITTPKRQAVNVLTQALTVPPNALRQVTVNHSAGVVPLITIASGSSQCVPWAFSVSATQIVIAVYNFTIPPAADANLTLTINFW